MRSATNEKLVVAAHEVSASCKRAAFSKKAAFSRQASRLSKALPWWEEMPQGKQMKRWHESCAWSEHHTWLCPFCHSQVVKTLVQAGADINEEDKASKNRKEVSAIRSAENLQILVVNLDQFVCKAYEKVIDICSWTTWYYLPLVFFSAKFKRDDRIPRWLHVSDGGGLWNATDVGEKRKTFGNQFQTEQKSPLFLKEKSNRTSNGWKMIQYPNL